MTDTTRIRNAMEYMAQVAAKDPSVLESEIAKIVGEDYVMFMDRYARAVLFTNPDSAGSLILLGYMLRVNEETGGMNVTQKRAQA